MKPCQRIAIVLLPVLLSRGGKVNLVTSQRDVAATEVAKLTALVEIVKKEVRAHRERRRAAEPKFRIAHSKLTTLEEKCAAANSAQSRADARGAAYAEGEIANLRTSEKKARALTARAEGLGYGYGRGGGVTFCRSD